MPEMRHGRVEIVPASEVVLEITAGAWPFADANRVAIDSHFATQKAARPSLFNGWLYMLSDWSLDCGIFRGSLIHADYASFLYWRDTGFRDPSVRNCFGSGVIAASDGALFLGIMGEHTANAGFVYPPSGSLEDIDVDGTRIDVDGNITREIGEETGLDVAGRAAPGWSVAFDGPRVALMRKIGLADPADVVADRIAAHFASAEKPELAGIHIVRGIDDIVSDRMPPYTQAWIRREFES